MEKEIDYKELTRQILGNIDTKCASIREALNRMSDSVSSLNEKTNKISKKSKKGFKKLENGIEKNVNLLKKKRKSSLN